MLWCHMPSHQLCYKWWMNREGGEPIMFCSMLNFKLNGLYLLKLILEVVKIVFTSNPFL